MFRAVFLLAAGFVFLANLLGLSPFAFPVTSYLLVVLSLSLIAFISFNLAGYVFFAAN